MAFIGAPFASVPRACTQQPLFVPRQTNPPKHPSSVSQRRLSAKRADKLPPVSHNDVDDQRRRQLAAESLSTADLAGILNTNPNVHADLPVQLPSPLQQAQLASTSPPSNNNPNPTKRKSSSASSPPLAATPPSPASPPSASTVPVFTSSETVVLQPDSLVLHERHGIGRFLGLERANTAAGTRQEYAVVSYRDGELYVPLSQLELLRPLSTEDAAQVRRLDNMQPEVLQRRRKARSSKARYHARRRAREHIRRQLVNLHDLYASRHTLKRKPFPVDQRAERIFFDACPFQLTADQHIAVQQVLNDLSSRDIPMDRLLCGDVGFGKTEVAIRAAFRALRAGKQVAVLAPTTILAHQHYDTFKQRFLPHYPQYQIACLSRFMPRRSVIDTRIAVQEGACRIAIGTHMLLSDSVSFADIGLLIVDEEHRFGVNQKEKIRSRYQGIDTLFLSATPIPRTLHLALSGLRDASILREAPAGRKPIATYVYPKGTGVIRRAIAAEMSRGGQIFFVVPRIDGIDTTADWLRQMFPKLRILVAHGQTSGLEQRIWDFAAGKYDMLVCTTIIENGINMPDVNTIIVHDATRFGLAQLHQLRGRVGRSDRQAFAWFLYSENTGGRSLQAVQRLKTLEQFNDLGSGFHIAQKDMEMRGVGTVLGVEQHGSHSVEAAEYARMLAEELEHIRTGQPIPLSLPVTDTVEVFLPVSSLIPEDFVSDIDEKMAAYTALSAAKTSKELLYIAKKMRARYGALPGSTIRHISVLELKMFARELGIRRIVAERQHVVLEWALEEEAFNSLSAFIEDEQIRSKLEHVVLEEKVVVRGLGICSGDVQLSKLLNLLKGLSKAAKSWPRRGGNAQNESQSHKLIDALYDVFQ